MKVERKVDAMTLCNVVERITLTVRPLNVILLQKGIDSLLDIRNLGIEPRSNLPDDFLNQCLVFHCLARLHDSDDGGLDNVFTILVDGLEYFSRLGFHFSFDRLVQVDSNLLRLEVGIEVILILLLIDQDLGLDQYGKNLNQNLLADTGGVDDLVEGERVIVVVLHKHGHLIRARHENVLRVGISGPKFILRVVP